MDEGAMNCEPIADMNRSWVCMYGKKNWSLLASVRDVIPKSIIFKENWQCFFDVVEQVKSYVAIEDSPWKMSSCFSLITERQKRLNNKNRSWQRATAYSKTHMQYLECLHALSKKRYFLNWDSVCVSYAQ